MVDANSKSSWARRLKRAGMWTLLAIAAFAFILVAGLVPVNRGFIEPEQGVTLYLVSNAVHADIIMPRSNGTVDWAQELGNAPFIERSDRLSHVAIGWGDKGFFLETPTWNDLKLTTAANALLLPSSTCVHVVFTKPDFYRDASMVTVSEEQYASLVKYIQRSMKRDANGQFIRIEDHAYGTTDAFFEALGNYHVLNTCNSWVGNGLKQAGVVVPWLTPMPTTPMLYLKRVQEG